MLDSDPAEAVAKSRDVLGDEPHNYQAYVISEEEKPLKCAVLAC